MKPAYTSEAFHVGDTAHGERVAIPADVYGTLDRFAADCDASGESDCERDPHLDGGGGES